MALVHRLIKFSDLTIYRVTQGEYVNGRWVPGVTIPINIKAKIQPLKDTELMSFPEDERNANWVKVYIQRGQTGTLPDVRTAQQGPNGWGADEFIWQGYRYQVQKDMNYQDSVLDYTMVSAKRLEVTPN